MVAENGTVEGETSHDPVCRGGRERLMLRNG